MIDYLEAARRCRTVNEFNRLHIGLEENLAPAEMAALRAIGGDALPRPSWKWLNRLRQLSPRMFKRPQPFQRRQLDQHVVAYRRDPAQRAERVLIAFAGIARRLGMPISAFLQCLDAESWDVLLIQRDRSRSYFDGWIGGPPDLAGLVDHIRTIGNIDEYARVSVIGSSSGGLAAVIAACLLDAEAGTAMSGVFDRDVRPDVAAAVAAAPGRPRLSFVHCGDNEIDAAAAAGLQALFGSGEIVAVEGCASHNVGYQLALGGLLTDFLSDVLGGDRPAKERQWLVDNPDR